MSMTEFDLDSAVRKVPDFPKPGILFYDITGILTNPDAFTYCIDSMESLYGNCGIEGIAGIESRGFIFAAPLAERLGLPLILIRKKGKLPGETISRKFSLEYGEDEIQIHKSDIRGGMKVLLVDDLIATGGTLKAAAELIEEGGGSLYGIFSVIGLPFLNYGKVLSDYDVKTLVEYHGDKI